MTSGSAHSIGITVAWIVAGSLMGGALTSIAQGLLPDSFRAVANSPSGSTLLTVALILASCPRLLPAACLGAVSFVCLVLGYTFASELRGESYDPTFWGAIGLLVGPAVGWSASAAAGGADLRATVRASGAADSCVANP